MLSLLHNIIFILIKADIVGIEKSKRIRSVEHVARMDEARSACRILLWKQSEGDRRITFSRIWNRTCKDRR
jgi:hypothetical protein